jgi:hypothetical protein
MLACKYRLEFVQQDVVDWLLDAFSNSLKHCLVWCFQFVKFLEFLNLIAQVLYILNRFNDANDGLFHIHLSVFHFFAGVCERIEN